jgi:hypothetical protein
MASHPNIDRPPDRAGEIDGITARLEGAKTSQGQIRFTLAMMAVISTMMLIASYNAYFSYDYRWIIESNERQLDAETEGLSRTAAEREEELRRKPASVEVARTLTDQALRDWAQSRIILISLLGIRVSVDDVVVLGTIVLLILSVCLVLWARRENHTITRLLRDTHRRRYDPRKPPVTQSQGGSKLYSREERWLIFHTINSNSIFITVYPSFRSVNSLEGEIKPASTGFKGRLNRVLFKLLRSFFSSFPVMAALVVFAIDRRSYFIADPFDPNFNPPGITSFFWTSLVVFLVTWIPLTIFCWMSVGYAHDTEKVLRQYEDKLKAERSNQLESSQG